MTITIQSLDDIHDAAKQFIANIGKRRVFAFRAGMGTGKTTFIKAICEELGVEDAVTSPTFSIVNEYTTAPPSHNTIYHLDLYRLKRIGEFYDMGGEDYLYSGNLCLIEWPELIEPVLPPDAVRVDMAELPDGSRTVTVL